MTRAVIVVKKSVFFFVIMLENCYRLRQLFHSHFSSYKHIYQFSNRKRLPLLVMAKIPLKY